MNSSILFTHQEKHWNIGNGLDPRSNYELIWNRRCFGEGITTTGVENADTLQFESKTKKQEGMETKLHGGCANVLLQQ